MDVTTHTYILREHDHFVLFSPPSRQDSSIRFLTGELSKWLTDNKIIYSLDYIRRGFDYRRDDYVTDYVIKIQGDREAMFFKLTWM